MIINYSKNIYQLINLMKKQFLKFKMNFQNGKIILKDLANMKEEIELQLQEQRNLFYNIKMKLHKIKNK